MRAIKNASADDVSLELSNIGTFSDVLDAYRRKDRLVCKVIEDAGKKLGFGLASLLNVLNPSVIVLVDELARADADFLSVVKEAVRERTIPQIFENTVIKLSAYKEDSILIGICQLVIEQALGDPLCFFREPEK